MLVQKSRQAAAALANSTMLTLRACTLQDCTLLRAQPM
jgi:hypothetical protein